VLGNNVIPDALDRFRQLIPDDWIEHALRATGMASLCRRRLAAKRLIWLVIGLALFRSEPVWHIVSQLGLALDSKTRVVPVPSATVQRRQRRGEALSAHLCDQISRAWCAASCDRTVSVSPGAILGEPSHWLWDRSKAAPTRLQERYATRMERRCCQRCTEANVALAGERLFSHCSSNLNQPAQLGCLGSQQGNIGPRLDVESE